MEDLKLKAENLTSSIGEYVETYYKLAILKTAEKITNLAASVLAFIAIVIFGMFVLFFAGIATGIWLGDLLGNPVAGYFIVAAFFLLMIIIIWLASRKIVFPLIRDFVIRKLYE